MNESVKNTGLKSVVHNKKSDSRLATADLDFEHLKKAASIEKVLAARGIKFIIKGNDLFFSAPWRMDDEPSVHVDRRKNCFYDHGDGSHQGDVMDLIRYIDKCDVITAAKKVAELSSSYVDPCVTEPSRAKGSEPSDKAISINRLTSVSAIALVRHCEACGLDMRDVRHYLREARYTGYYGDERYALAFRNSAGGYALRMATKKHNKRNAGTNTFAAFTSSGELLEGAAADLKPSSAVVVVVEGWKDMLSYLEAVDAVKVGGHRVPSCVESETGETVDFDMVVLNSTSNVRAAMDFIVAHELVQAYLDNDEAGERATAAIKDNCLRKGVRMEDCRSVYAGSKDINEMMACRKEERKTGLKP